MDIVDVPAGFKYSGLASGIKKTETLDLGLIVSAVPAACAGVFTTNKVIAAPLQLTKPNISQGKCQAILVNSGNANACTGTAGMQVAKTTIELVAEKLSINADLVAVASTGVIGEQLSLQPFENNMAQLVEGLSVNNASIVA